MHVNPFTNQLFHRLDRDKNGTINLLRPFSNPKTQHFLHMADCNRDHHVDRFEMKNAVKHFIDRNHDRHIGPAERNMARVRFGF